MNTKVMALAFSLLAVQHMAVAMEQDRAGKDLFHDCDQALVACEGIGLLAGATCFSIGVISPLCIPSLSVPTCAFRSAIPAIPTCPTTAGAYVCAPGTLVDLTKNLCMIEGAATFLASFCIMRKHQKYECQKAVKDQNRKDEKSTQQAMTYNILPPKRSK